MSDEQLVLLCLGNFTPDKTAFTVGVESISVAGAAGETTHHIDDIPSIVMADGPAGLRLQTLYGKDEKGIYSISNDISSDMSDFVTEKLAALLGLNRDPSRKGSVHEQYCTAIPIGTALTQSWNTEVCYQCGELVAEEMERFGVHLWLAPALNIQRSPLCGCNFEYYSEDPYLSGTIAAALTQGVQTRHNCGATIKHFVCNNQETNRFASNSVVSERALREIYLKGFEICIREASPIALMTSYDLLNGIHTSEDFDLLYKILRCEMGYSGVVMSDWVTHNSKKSLTKYDYTAASKSIAAGNDLFMPGSQFDFDEVLTAIKENKITRAQLLTSAGSVFKTIQKFRVR